MSTTPPSRDGFEAFLGGYSHVEPPPLLIFLQSLLAFQPTTQRAPEVAETEALLTVHNSSRSTPNNSTPSGTLTRCFSCFSCFPSGTLTRCFSCFPMRTLRENSA